MTDPTATRREDYTPPPYLIDQVDLDVVLDPAATVVRATLAVRPTPAGDRAPLPLRLDGHDLALRTIALDGAPLDAGACQADDRGLTLAQPPARPFRLTTEVAIDPARNTALEGLYLSRGTYCTQCEAEGFRRITYFLDRPDVTSRYRVRITGDAERCPVLLSNGNLVETGTTDDGRPWAVWDDPFAKPCYLFALVAGNLSAVEDSFTTRSGRTVALKLFVEPGNEDKCGHALASLKKAMAWDEQTFGLEYDLDVFHIVAIGDFNMGAMENKSLNVFNTKYVLAKPETATDFDYRAVEAVVAHEYFHNWTGNRVTCRDWFQLSLKEGLTVYREQEFASDVGSRALRRITDVQRLRASQFVEDAGPLAHPVRPDSYIEINNFYTATVYEKGAEVVRMLATVLGRDAFREGLRLYLSRHDGEAVTCDDFVACLAEAAGGVDLTQFMLWYSQAGTPELTVDGIHDSASATYRLIVRQSTPATPGQPDKRPLMIPLAVGLVGPDGRDLPLHIAGDGDAPAPTTRVLTLTEPEHVFVFHGIAAPPVPSLLRGFSAPVRVRAGLPDEALAFLMAHDSDSFGRWDAGHALAVRLLLGLVADRRAGRPLALPDLVFEAVDRLLDLAEDDPAFAAHALTLPSESYLAQELIEIDVDGLHAAREFARRALGRRLIARWRAVYDACSREGPYAIDAAAMGRRALRGVALAYLMASGEPEAVDLAVAQFERATNMTDTQSALLALANSDAPARPAVLDAFYRRWQGEPLVVDKWLSVQATSNRTDTLSVVQGLVDHPAFDPGNPNKIYALIGAFAGGNQVRFHDASGAGYRFLADQILRLDATNPQVASRITGPFTRWRRFDPGRQALMRAELDRIQASGPLSPDVFEIVAKSLTAG